MTPTELADLRAAAFHPLSCHHSEVRALIEAYDDLLKLTAAIPRTGMQAFDCVRSHSASFGPVDWVDGKGYLPVGPVENVRFTASIHDLLSMFNWAGLGIDQLPPLSIGDESLRQNK